MANDKIQAIILAAGKSTRFNTGGSKLTERICGKEMIIHTTRILEKLHIPTTLVVGYKKELVQAAIEHHHPETPFTFVEQTEQLGTGHALACSKPLWNREHILVLNGDTPLLTSQLIQNLIDTHVDAQAALSFVVARNVDPSVRGLGHVIQEGNYIKIVEDRHMNHDHLEMADLNAGIYLFQKSFLLDHVENLPRHKVSGEFYLTTLIEIASYGNLRVCTVDAAFDTVRGVNTLKELWVAEHLKRSYLIEHWMNHGVRFSSPQTVHIDEDVSIGHGAYIGSCAQLFGKTHIGDHSSVCAFTVLHNAKIGDNTNVQPHSIVKESTIGNNCKIDSFTYIYNKSVIHDNCTISSFTEVNHETIKATTPEPATGKKKDKTFVAAFKTVADQTFAETP